jgi:hypothetical protein
MVHFASSKRRRSDRAGFFKGGGVTGAFRSIFVCALLSVRPQSTSADGSKPQHITWTGVETFEEAYRYAGRNSGVLGRANDYFAKTVINFTYVEETDEQGSSHFVAKKISWSSGGKSIADGFEATVCSGSGSADVLGRENESIPVPCETYNLSVHWGFFPKPPSSISPPKLVSWDQLRGGCTYSEEDYGTYSHHTYSVSACSGASNPILKIDQPAAGTVFKITSDPQMPQLAAHAGILNLHPDPTSTTSFTWTTEIRYTGPDGRAINLDIPESAVTGGSYTTQSADKTRGGTLKFKASASINGSNLTDQTEGDVIQGINPTHQQVNGKLVGPPATNIACWESGKTLHQFDDDGWPLFGPPHGYGIMQVDNPPVSDEGVWNWQQNVSEGLAILAQKRAEAQVYPKHVQQHYPDATDYVSSGAVDAATGQSYVVLDTIRRYNGGTYWKWDDDAKLWEKAPQDDYVAHVLASNCP